MIGETCFLAIKLYFESLVHIYSAVVILKVQAIGGIQKYIRDRVAEKMPLEFIYLLRYLFIWLHPVLAVACGISSFSKQTLSCPMWDLVPRQGTEPRPSASGTES